jgi:hypothetical protein
MKRGVISFLTLVAILFLRLFAGASAFELKSPDIQVDKPIGEKFVYNSLGCSGQNVSPELIWSDPPEGTRSFAVVVHDPDAPTGGAGFFHWIVTDFLPPRALSHRGPEPPTARNWLQEACNWRMTMATWAGAAHVRRRGPAPTVTISRSMLSGLRGSAFQPTPRPRSPSL